jgi:hypothetical protein
MLMVIGDRSDLPGCLYRQNLLFHLEFKSSAAELLLDCIPYAISVLRK